MHENHKITVGIISNPEVLNPQCSCTKCDSVICFAKTRAKLSCGCENCNSNCKFKNININTKVNPSLNMTSSTYLKDLQREKAIEKVKQELTKNEIVEYEYNQDNLAKVVSMKQSKLSHKPVDTVVMRNESDRPTKVHSLVVDSSRKEESSSAAELSAQIMNVSYNEFQKSIAKPKIPSNIANLSPFDIINKIKEAYKACSCKVCECIVGKSFCSDICKCKPCECNDCANFTRRNHSFTDSELILKDDEGCPCIKCNRGSCKAIAKVKDKAQECDCIGVLNDGCLSGKDSLIKSCNCEPCQCLECKLKSIRRQRLIVAPVGEDNQQRNVCECSPCECFSCGHGYGLPSHVHHEMSTSVNRHPQCHCETCINEACIPDGNQSCGCERQSKVMSKPVQQDSHDYDIRRATVINDNLLRYRDKYDTIAMRAAVPNNYPRLKENSKQCDCDSCECLFCKYKESTEQRQSSKVFVPIQNESNECNGLPCEYHLRTKHVSKANNLKNENSSINIHDLKSSNFAIDTHATKKTKSKFLANVNYCTCNFCECIECQKLMTTCVGDICTCTNCKCEKCIKETYSDDAIYPVKRGERLTPSIYKNKIKDAFIESCINTLEANEEILKDPVGFYSLTKPLANTPLQKTKFRDHYTNGALSQNCFKKYYSKPKLSQNFVAERVKQTHYSKCADELKSHCGKSDQNLEVSLSIESSILMKESENVTPSRNTYKCWERSCNSLRHDYPSNLMYLPETTSETCLNDVMQLETDNSINLTTAVALNSNKSILKENAEFNNKRKLSEYQPKRAYFSREKSKNNNIIDQYTERPHEIHKHSKTLFEKDYESVQNTLHEARAFSQHLVLLLEKYEKANREFESVSEKIKKSNYSIPTKINIAEYTNTEISNGLFFMHEMPTREENSKMTSGSSAEELVEIDKNANKTYNNLFSHGYQIAKDEIKEDLLEQNKVYNDNNEGRDESGDDVIKINYDLLKTIFEEPINIGPKSYKRRVGKRLHRNVVKMYKRSIFFSKKRNRFTYNCSGEINSESKNNPIPYNNNDVNKIFEHRQEIPENITGCNKSEMKSNVSEKNNIPKVIEKSTTEMNASVTEKFENDTDIVNIKEPIVEYSNYDNHNKLSVLKKHVIQNMNKLRFSLTTLLKTDVQDATKTRQPSDFHENMALRQKNSSEALKVNFLNVRRVSDHTALVKWGTPLALDSVEGYELLVDGRSVQKIFSRSRCMAVVTCLPHSEKVLLTVRTVISSPCSEHCGLSVTVIYQPKIK